MPSAGAAVFFRRNTWHHAFNPGRLATRVVEFFAPPPSHGTASDYARRQTPPEGVRYRDSRYDGRWPMAREEWQAARRLWVLDDSS
ncbi:MAG: hypothetical protein GEU92_20900, partial [Alphaproteobacteria bacterium]|nr:hypothetical protein [Alphaproteobacteria bacterium]